MLALDHLLYAYRDDPFLSVGAIVGHDDHLVTVGSYFLFEDDKILRPSGKHRHDLVAGLVQGSEDREDRGDAYAASRTHHRAVFLDLRGRAERSHDVLDISALGELAELRRRQTHFLHH